MDRTTTLEFWAPLRNKFEFLGGEIDRSPPRSTVRSKNVTAGTELFLEGDPVDHDHVRSLHLEQGRVICDCGTLHEEASKLIVGLKERVTELLEDLDEKTQTIERQAVELNRQHRKIAGLQREVDGQITASPYYHDAIEVLEYWKERCHPNARELHGERCKKVEARLSGKPKPYSKDELKEAVVGYSRFPYIVEGRRAPLGTPGQRYVDAELIFRDPKHVDQGIALAKEAERRDQPMPEIVSPGHGSKLSEMGQMAVRLADKLKWYIFPVHPKAKVPATANGLKDATIDVTRIMRFWLRHPNHNIGLRCGAYSQIFVLDVDGDVGFESLRKLEKEHGELPKTLSVVTPRGGQHFYFRHPGGEIRNSTGFPGFGLDIRGDGGYVLAPPSIGPNGRCYEVDERMHVVDPPSWLISLLLEYQRTMKEIDVTEYEKIFEGVAEGGRNSRMTQYVGRLWHKHTPAEVLGIALAINHDYCKPPLPDKEVKAIVDSIARREKRSQERRTKATLEGLEYQQQEGNQ